MHLLNLHLNSLPTFPDCTSHCYMFPACRSQLDNYIKCFYLQLLWIIKQVWMDCFSLLKMFKLNASQMSQPRGCSSALWEVPGCVRLLLMEHYGWSLPISSLPPQVHCAKEPPQAILLIVLWDQGLGGDKGISQNAHRCWRWAELQRRFEPELVLHLSPQAACEVQYCAAETFFGEAWRTLGTSTRLRAAAMGSSPAASHQFFQMLLSSTNLIWGFPSLSPTKVFHPELVGQSFGGLWSSWLSLVSLGAEAGEYWGDDGFCPAGIGWCPTKHSHSRNSSCSLQLYFAFF